MTNYVDFTSVSVVFNIILLLILINSMTKAWGVRKDFKEFKQDLYRDVTGRRWVIYSTITDEVWHTDRGDIRDHIMSFLDKNQDKYGKYIIITVDIGVAYAETEHGIYRTDKEMQADKDVIEAKQTKLPDDHVDFDLSIDR